MLPMSASLSPLRLPLPLMAALSLAIIARLRAGMSFPVWPEGRRNPELFHRFAMPLFLLLMLHEDPAHAFPRYLLAAAEVHFLGATLTTLRLLELGAAGLYAAAVGWSHTLVAFLPSISLVSFLSASTTAWREISSASFLQQFFVGLQPRAL